jgi:hypothetical protein
VFLLVSLSFISAYISAVEGQHPTWARDLASAATTGYDNLVLGGRIFLNRNGHA